MHLLSIVGSESAGKPWRSVARRDDARTGASSGYSRLAPAIETRGGVGGAVGGASGGDNAFKRAALVRYVLLLIARCDIIFVTKIGTGQARQRTGRS